jgi:hypothetical protein
LLKRFGTTVYFFAREVILLVALFSPCVGFSSEIDDAKNPMYFDVVGDGVTVLPVELDYDITTNDGSAIRMGPFRMDSGNFFADVVQIGKMDSKLSPLLPKESAGEWIFVFRWPEEFMHQGKLELISRSGRVIWEQEIGEEQKKAWAKSLEPWKQIMAKNGYNPQQVAVRPIFNIQYGVRDIEKKETPFFSLNEPFRFCFSRKQGPGMTRMCSPQSEMNREGGRLRIKSVALSPQPPRVIIMGEPAKLTDIIQLPLNKPVSFFAENKYGMSYEFFALPRKAIIIDMVKSDNGTISIALTGEEPLTPSIRINDRKNLSFVERLYDSIGWQETIGDFRKFWRIQMDAKNPFVMVDGIGGGSFKQKFEIKKVPEESMRPKLDDRTFKQTYADGTKIYGTKPPGSTVKSLQNSLSMTSDDGDEFIWKFGAKKKGEINHSYLTVEKDGQTYRAYHEAYRGYANEFSLRMSGIPQFAGIELDYFTLLGEVAYNYWFEDILGWNNYYLSKQRWGTSVKAFQALNDIHLGLNGTISSPLYVTTAELRYRFDPGLWGRDETWGLLIGYQNVSTQQQFTNINMLGWGLFWARSMPKVFDGIFNWFPFMKYPKWVDMEFIYYLTTNSANLTLEGTTSIQDTLSSLSKSEGGANYALNFHGQVMWSKTIFGEAGFGIKGYSVRWDKPGATEVDRDRRRRFDLTSIYGTAGIGIKF